MAGQEFARALENFGQNYLAMTRDQIQRDRDLADEARRNQQKRDDEDRGNKQRRADAEWSTNQQISANARMKEQDVRDEAAALGIPGSDTMDLTSLRAEVKRAQGLERTRQTEAGFLAQEDVAVKILARRYAKMLPDGVTPDTATREEAETAEDKTKTQAASVGFFNSYARMQEASAEVSRAVAKSKNEVSSYDQLVAVGKDFLEEKMAAIDAAEADYLKAKASKDVKAQAIALDSLRNAARPALQLQSRASNTDTQVLDEQGLNTLNNPVALANRARSILKDQESDVITLGARINPALLSQYQQETRLKTLGGDASSPQNIAFSKSLDEQHRAARDLYESAKTIGVALPASALTMESFHNVVTSVREYTTNPKLSKEQYVNRMTAGFEVAMREKMGVARTPPQVDGAVPNPGGDPKPDLSVLKNAAAGAGGKTTTDLTTPTEKPAQVPAIQASKRVKDRGWLREAAEAVDPLDILTGGPLVRGVVLGAAEVSDTLRDTATHALLGDDAPAANAAMYNTQAKSIGAILGAPSALNASTREGSSNLTALQGGPLVRGDVQGNALGGAQAAAQAVERVWRKQAARAVERNEARRLQHETQPASVTPPATRGAQVSPADNAPIDPRTEFSLAVQLTEEEGLDPSSIEGQNRIRNVNVARARELLRKWKSLTPHSPVEGGLPESDSQFQ